MNSEVLVTFKGDTKDLDNKTNSAKSSLKGFANVAAAAFKVTATAVAGATAAEEL